MPEDRDSLLAFPCRFPIKVMGRAEAGFELLVVETVRRHAPDLDHGLVRLRESRGGNWLSVTVVVDATSKDQLDAIYRDLTAEEKVVWAL